MPTLMCTTSKACKVHQQAAAAAINNAANHTASAAQSRSMLTTAVDEKLTATKSSAAAAADENCCVSDDILDFVIVGNGPSGISLSYLLSGNWPYYTRDSDDEMLHARLMDQPHLSLVEQDLEFLSDGLEGRSNNPVPVLLDTLQRPKADLGLDLPSNLTWRKLPAKAVKHVVLGQGQPGGVWQTLEGNVKTVSLGAWMQLPALTMPEWKQNTADLADRRTLVSDVAKYYTDYVQYTGIQQNFRNHTVVTKVRQLKSAKVCKLSVKTRASPPKTSAIEEKAGRSRNVSDDSTKSSELTDANAKNADDTIEADTAAEGKESSPPQQLASLHRDSESSGYGSSIVSGLTTDSFSNSNDGGGRQSLNVDDILQFAADSSNSNDDKMHANNDEDDETVTTTKVTVICCLCEDCDVVFEEVPGGGGARGSPGRGCPLLAAERASAEDDSCCQQQIEGEQMKDQDQEELFAMDDDDLSSVCSSLTRFSSSPIRDTRDAEPYDISRSSSSSRCWRSDSTSSCCACVNGDGAAAGAGGAADRSSAPIAFTSQNLLIPMSAEMICPSWDPIINPYLFSFPNTGTTPLMTPSLSATSFNPKSSYQRRNSVAKYISCEKLDPPPTLFEVSGYEMADSAVNAKPFKYLTKNVVLATGLNKPKKLDVPGEHFNFVFHKLKDLESAVASERITPNSDPIMIIGAGLTAADAIISAQDNNIPVVHVFRRSVKDPQMILNKLPMNLYPEYEKVRNMMAEGSVITTRPLRGGEHLEPEHPKYRAYAEASVLEITKDREVLIAGPDSKKKINVSCVLALIGAYPQLDFLDVDSQVLARNPDEPLSKNNPVDIDPFTHECVNMPGMFALGPLVGDNFVRFLQGGALAITSFANKQQTQNNSESDKP